MAARWLPDTNKSHQNHQITQRQSWKPRVSDVQCPDRAMRRSGCESVNREMVRQVQKHEELVRALAALKDTNRRLVEQIRS